MDFEPGFGHITRKVAFNGWDLATTYLILKLGSIENIVNVPKDINKSKNNAKAPSDKHKSDKASKVSKDISKSEYNTKVSKNFGTSEKNTKTSTIVNTSENNTKISKDDGTSEKDLNVSKDMKIYFNVLRRVHPTNSSIPNEDSQKVIDMFTGPGSQVDEMFTPALAELQSKMNLGHKHIKGDGKDRHAGPQVVYFLLTRYLWFLAAMHGKDDPAWVIQKKPHTEVFTTISEHEILDTKLPSIEWACKSMSPSQFLASTDCMLSVQQYFDKDRNMYFGRQMDVAQSG